VNFNIENLRPLRCLTLTFFSGVHHKKAQCDTEKVVKKVQAILEKANPYLYPKNLIVTTLQPKKNAKLPKGNQFHKKTYLYF
jgi:hypothetical protein